MAYPMTKAPNKDKRAAYSYPSLRKNLHISFAVIYKNKPPANGEKIIEKVINIRRIPS